MDVRERRFGELSNGVSTSVEALALPLLAGTQAAALACVDWVGRGDRHEADRAAVAAMRARYQTLPADAEVVVGEGEKDAAPMLHVGERLGTGHGPRVDLAVDPLEGTNFCATGREGAIAIVACAPRGAFWRSPAAYYMDKMVVGPQAAGAVLDLDAPVADRLRAVARASGKAIDDLRVVVLSKPRHAGLIAEIRSHGARVLEIPDGDIAGALQALLPDGGADILMGIGGAPEGVITACAALLLGGNMVGRLAPQSEAEAARLRAEGVDLGEQLGLHRLVASRDCVVAASGVTGGLLDPPRRVAEGWETHSLLLTATHPALHVRALVPPLAG